jgi:FkbM family methyltransferase
MLGDLSKSIEERTDWVWVQVARLHPEVRRENFVGLAGDPYMIHDHIVDNICKYTPKKGHLVMDIGANVGVFTTYCALNGAKVVAYEPDFEAASVLYDTLEKNQVQNLVKVTNSAVWIHTGTASFYFWPGHSIIGTLSKVRAEECQKKDPGLRSTITTISLKDALGVEEWDCVKVDIEGGEFELFTDAGNELQQIKYLTMELHNDAVDKVGHDRLVQHLSQVFEIQGVKDGSPQYKPENRWISIYATRKQ